MTFSIVARDASTGAVGVGTATGGPVVGALVPHGAARLGAIATQGYTNPLFGIDGLTLLEEGLDAEAVVDRLIAADEGRDRRQLIVIDGNGATAGWSGEGLTPHAGMILAQDVAVAGNLLARPEILEAMASAYRDAAALSLEKRLLASLRAGEDMGGDARGTRSASILTWDDQPYARYDMRIDLAADPIGALATLLSEVDGPDYGTFYEGLPRRPV